MPVSPKFTKPLKVFVAKSWHFSLTKKVRDIFVFQCYTGLAYIDRGKHHVIASVTFGETRVFKVRHKTRKDIESLNIPLMHGSLVLMGETMQLT